MEIALFEVVKRRSKARAGEFIRERAASIAIIDTISWMRLHPHGKVVVLR
ncbi:hypothetical protein [Caballeronia grimmiae]|nr:hypothetical protein [Caballeronia grimmiae]